MDSSRNTQRTQTQTLEPGGQESQGYYGVVLNPGPKRKPPARRITESPRILSNDFNCSTIKYRQICKKSNCLWDDANEKCTDPLDQNATQLVENIVNDLNNIAANNTLHLILSSGSPIPNSEEIMDVEEEYKENISNSNSGTTKPVVSESLEARRKRYRKKIRDNRKQKELQIIKEAQEQEEQAEHERQEREEKEEILKRERLEKEEKEEKEAELEAE